METSYNRYLDVVFGIEGRMADEETASLSDEQLQAIDTNEAVFNAWESGKPMSVVLALLEKAQADDCG